MNNTQFHDMADWQLRQIEQIIDESDLDIDCDVVGNVMTLVFLDQSEIVINRQEALHEIWLASKRGGFHFRYQDNEWICSRSNRTLSVIITEECCFHAQADIELKLTPTP